MFNMIIELAVMLAMLAEGLLEQNIAMTIALATLYLVVAIRNMVNEVRENE